MKCAALMVEPM